ncbi:MAG: FAD binding domain-containing protein [Pseudorhodobacter sp.]|nr:FAD binding domain-containing protein [Pseudorhodobacter sp.]
MSAGLAIAAPRDLAALRALMAEGPLVFLAGGTDALVSGRNLPVAGRLVDLSRVAGLAFIDSAGADIRIGAATTVAALAADPGLSARLPALAQAAALCGAVQIRNRATLGGNIANAAPAADLTPVLLAAQARLALTLPGGARAEVALDGFTPLPGTLITEVILPGTALLPHSAFAKLGPRRELTIARLNLAALAEYDQGRFGAVRLVAGALGPRPRRLPRAEVALAGQVLDAVTLRGYLAALSAEVEAAIPGRASLAWKRRAIAGPGLEVIAGIAGLAPRDALFDTAFGVSFGAVPA